MSKKKVSWTRSAKQPERKARPASAQRKHATGTTRKPASAAR
jgi:hypothetical protein